MNANLIRFATAKSRKVTQIIGQSGFAEIPASMSSRKSRVSFSPEKAMTSRNDNDIKQRRASPGCTVVIMRP